MSRGLHESIIDRELFEQVQKMREARAHRLRSYANGMRRIHLLSGLAFCTGCGSPVWTNSTKQGRHSYLRCSSRSRGNGCPDRLESVRADVVETQASTVFSAIQHPTVWRERVAELASEEDTDYEAECAKLEARIARARHGFVAGVLDEGSAKTAVRDAERELATLPTESDTRGAVAAGTTLSDVHQLWPSMSAEERRTFIQMSVDAVAVDLRCGEVRGMLPKDSFAPLFRVIADDDGVIRVADWPDDEKIRAWRPRADSGSASNNRVRKLFTLRKT